MATNRKFLLSQRPTGTPDDDTFELVEEDVPEPGPGEALVRTLYLSVDPYMRGRMDAGESYAEPWDVGEPLEGGVVGEVVESNGTEFEEGDIVTGNLEWADYVTALGPELQQVNPDLAPISTALGVLGMPGLTGYFGTREVLQPRAGDTVVVTGAAGAVGSTVGQISKLTGAKVIGFAGSDEKVSFLEDDLGFDVGINYKDVDDYGEALDEAAPEGVDRYFDNVGGEITDSVFARLNVDARVAVCGQIALYNATSMPTGPRKLGKLIETRATVEGLLVGDFAPRYAEGAKQLGQWISEGKIEYRETVTEGLENAPDAFLGLFEGDNIGKQLVKVGERGRIIDIHRQSAHSELRFSHDITNERRDDSPLGAVQHVSGGRTMHVERIREVLQRAPPRRLVVALLHCRLDHGLLALGQEGSVLVRVSERDDFVSNPRFAERRDELPYALHRGGHLAVYPAVADGQRRVGDASGRDSCTVGGWQWDSNSDERRLFGVVNHFVLDDVGIVLQVLDYVLGRNVWRFEEDENGAVIDRMIAKQSKRRLRMVPRDAGDGLDLWLHLRVHGRHIRPRDGTRIPLMNTGRYLGKVFARPLGSFPR